MPELTLTEKIADDLRRSIENGDLEPGGKLPSEAQLSATWDTSRVTVRRALLTLEQEGLVAARSGIGRVVRDYAPLDWHLTTWENGSTRPDDPGHGIDAWDHDMQLQGRNPRQEVSVSYLPAPVYVAQKLQVNVGDMLVRRRRLRFADEVPVSIADSWFERDVAERKVKGTAPLLEARDMQMAGGIIRSIGINQVRFLDEIRVRMPSSEESSLLGLPGGSPVGQHARVGVDDTDRHIRVIISVFPGHRIHCLYELEV